MKNKFNILILTILILIIAISISIYYLKDIWYYTISFNKELSIIQKINNIKNNEIFEVEYKPSNISTFKNKINWLNLLLESGADSTVFTSLYEKEGKYYYKLILSNILDNKSKQEYIEKYNNYLRDAESNFEKEIQKIYHISYNYDLLKELLDKKVWIWETILYKPANKWKNSSLIIRDTELDKYFSKEQIEKWFITWDRYTTWLIDIKFSKFYNEWEQQKWIYDLKLENIQERKGFDITDKSYPIVSIAKKKFEWTWLLVSNYNQSQYKKLESLEKNITQLVKSPKEMTKENDMKQIENQSTQYVYNFTEFDIEKYYNFYFKNNKSFKTLKTDFKNNTMILENDKFYILLYFDKNKIYEYNEDTILSQWKNYIFWDINSVEVISHLISKEYLDKILKDIEKYQIKKENLKYFNFDMFFWNIYLKEK